MISLTSEPIWISFTVKHLIGPEIILGYYIFINKYLYVFRLFVCPSIFHIEPLDGNGRGTAASYRYRK